MKKKFIESMFEFMSVVTSSVVTVALIFSCVFRVTTVSGESMVPTLSSGDRLLTSAYRDEYNYKDIVIVVEPNELNEPLVKRVIATEGQWIDVNYSDGLVYVGDSPDNMQPLDEKYTASLTTKRNFDDINDYPIQVPEGHYFCMGDNRNHSTDSRSYKVGFIDENYIMGKALFKLIPFGVV